MPYCAGSSVIGHVLGQAGDGRLVTAIIPRDTIILVAERREDEQGPLPPVVRAYRMICDRQLWVRSSFLEEVNLEELGWPEDPL
jgi:hypothetical protein